MKMSIWTSCKIIVLRDNRTLPWRVKRLIFKGGEKEFFKSKLKDVPSNYCRSKWWVDNTPTVQLNKSICRLIQYGVWCGSNNFFSFAIFIIIIIIFRSHVHTILSKRVFFQCLFPHLRRFLDLFLFSISNITWNNDSAIPNNFIENCNYFLCILLSLLQDQ